MTTDLRDNQGSGALPVAKWSWRCFFGVHQWTKWSVERPMFRNLQGQMVTMGQDRHCINCNKIESRVS